ncbi:MAG: hypothetical protein ACE5NJ_04750 [Thermodesulfobacteriota bacterium]
MKLSRGGVWAPQIPGQPNVPNYEAVGNVTTIADGDTNSVSLTWVNGSPIGINAGSFETTKFAGEIDTSEIGEEGAEGAKEFVIDLCPPGTEVLLDLDNGVILGAGPYRDIYRRLLAVIYVRGN